MIRLPKIKTAELSTYGNFAMCHQAHFRVPRVGLGTRLVLVNRCCLSVKITNYCQLSYYINAYSCLHYQSHCPSQTVKNMTLEGSSAQLKFETDGVHVIATTSCATSLIPRLFGVGTWLTALTR